MLMIRDAIEPIMTALLWHVVTRVTNFTNISSLKTVPKPLLYIEAGFICICCVFLSGNAMCNWIDWRFFKIVVYFFANVECFFANSASLFEALPLYFFKSHCLSDLEIFVRSFVDSFMRANCADWVFTGWFFLEKLYSPRIAYVVRKNIFYRPVVVLKVGPICFACYSQWDHRTILEPPGIV